MSYIQVNMQDKMSCLNYLKSFRELGTVVSEDLQKCGGQTDRAKTIHLPTTVGEDIIIIN